MASTAAPTAPPGAAGFKVGRNAAQQARYGTPLPVLLPCSPLYPSPPPSALPAPAASLAALFVARLAAPQVTGVLDRATASVWVSDPAEWRVLFERGFFGKGTLSRSEPTWRQTRRDLLRGGASLAAEQLRQKRREERKRFKLDRAQAMMEAVIKAEAVLAAGGASGAETPVAGPSALPSDGPGGLDGVDLDDGEGADSVESGPDRVAGTAGTSSATAASGSQLPPGTQLTPQTFLVRPTRPDANRNRGKNAFKRRPPPPAASTAPGDPTGQATQAETAPGAGQAQEVAADEDEVAEGDEIDEDLVAEMEHLQLSYEEACFLSIGLGVLRIYDPETDTFPPLPAVLALFLTPAPAPPLPAPLIRPPPPAHTLHPSDPFLVRYAAYHHFRSLGWCVRDGVKFCADLLLYRKGPVFSHSAFALLLVPVWADDADRAASPYKDEDWYAERMSWRFMNTVMRVNSLVMKTVIIVYITIPPVASFPARERLGAAGLDARRADLRSLLGRYSVREVALTRFGIARRRD